MLAPSHRYTSSVCGTWALANRVSLSSKVVSSGSEEEEREARKVTMERVLAMSGILSWRPVRRRVVEDSMNWYFLGEESGS